MLLRCEVTLENTNQHDRQNNGTHEYVGAVKAGKHEEGRSVDARIQGKAQIVVSMEVLGNLQPQEDQSECHGQS